MTPDILSWYKRSAIERVLENRLAEYGITLAPPQVDYDNGNVVIDRIIKVQYKNIKKTLGVSREFSPDTYSEDIWFDLEKEAKAGICNYEDYYTAYWYVYHKNRELLDFLQKNEDLEIYVTEKLKLMNKYGIDGDIKKLTNILVDYWIKLLPKGAETDHY
jgi:hypothetical protein